MVVKMRLSRWGSSHNPFYKIVAIHAKKARDGKYFEDLGTYNPIADLKGVKHISLNIERIKYWIGVGAQPSDRVHWLLSKINLLPQHPKYLQGTGNLSLTDPKTWSLKVSDNGKMIKMISPQEAIEQFADLEIKKPIKYISKR